MSRATNNTGNFQVLNNSRIFPDTPDNSDHELDHVPSQATELVTQVGKDDDVVEEVIHLMIVVRTMVKTTRLIMQKCPQKQVCCHRSREAHLWCLRPLNREPKLRCDPISLCALPLLCNHLQTPPHQSPIAIKIKIIACNYFSTHCDKIWDAL